MNKAIPYHPGAWVAFYCRDSGGEEQELSIARQEAEFQRWCSAHGLIPGKIFKDAARPGSSVVGRQGFQDMMRHFRSGQAPEAGLVIWNYQRFARDVDDSQFFRADLRRRGFIFYSLNDDVPEGPMGRFIEAALERHTRIRRPGRRGLLRAGRRSAGLGPGPGHPFQTRQEAAHVRRQPSPSAPAQFKLPALRIGILRPLRLAPLRLERPPAIRRILRALYLQPEKAQP